MMDTYLTIEEAAKHAKRSEPYLNQLAQVGKIKSIRTKSGEIMVSEKDIEDLQKKDFAELEGSEISMGDAERKYNVPHQTISRWKANGYIRVIRKEGQKVIMNEADVARLVEAYKTNPGQGKWTARKTNLTKK